VAQGSNPGEEEDFRKRPDRFWGPPPLTKWATCLFPGDKKRGERLYLYSPLLIQGLIQGELYLYIHFNSVKKCGIIL
jgi:hypothetical protein